MAVTDAPAAIAKELFQPATPLKSGIAREMLNLPDAAIAVGKASRS